MNPVFDAHLHIINPQYPLVENQGYLPGSFQVEDYLDRVKHLGVRSGAVVSGSFQAFDQNYLLDALSRLGDQYVGVTQLPVSTPDEQILSLNAQGIRAVRFNVRRGGSEDVRHLEKFSRRIYDLAGWHVELYASAESLSALEPVLPALPAISIDHLGLDSNGLDRLRLLASKGVYIKATGFGRLDFDAFDAIKMLYSENPDVLMFGTDLPSTRASKPFEDSHLFELSGVLDADGVNKVLWHNARRFYRLDDGS